MTGRFSSAAAQAAATPPRGSDPGLAALALLGYLAIGGLFAWQAHGITHGILYWLVQMLVCGSPFLVALRASRPHAKRRIGRRKIVLGCAWAAGTALVILLVWVLPDTPLLPRTWALTVPAGLLVVAPFVLAEARELWLLRRQHA